MSEKNIEDFINNQMVELFEKKDSRGTVALFIDNDNFWKAGVRYDFNVIIEKSKEYGHLKYKYAYGDINNPKLQFQFFKLGIIPIYTPAFGNKEDGIWKSLADPMIICDILSTLYEKPDIDTFILASSDKDFIPVLFHLHKFRKQVIVIGLQKNTSEETIQIINNHGFKFLDYNIIYDEIKNKSGNRVE